MPKPTHDLIGDQFGKLKVVSQYRRDGATYCLCICECGQTKDIRAKTLLNGMSKSCGCGRGDFNRSRTKHGASTRSVTRPEYWVWQAMIQRCTNRNNKGYGNYGGRGIQVCNRWLTSYSNFIQDLGYRPSNKHSLERLDNNKGYSPENCKWATRLEQNMNKRKGLRVFSTCWCGRRANARNLCSTHYGQWWRSNHV